MQSPLKMKRGPSIVLLSVTSCLALTILLWPGRKGGLFESPTSYPALDPLSTISLSEGQAPIPFMGNYQCSTELCTEFLTEDDWNWVHEVEPKNSPQFHKTCHFMNGTNRPAVLLMTFTGSGTTWLRQLLEQATGICTGSVFRDTPLRLAGLNGESIRSGTVLVTQNHKAVWPTWSNAAILLIRNPLDAFVAEWNILQGKGTFKNRHVRLAKEQNFGNNPEWNMFIHGQRKGRGWFSAWTDYFKWLVDSRCSGRPVLVVKYEDLKSDLITQMKRILEFLGVPYSDEALQRRMHSGNFEKFHRSHRKETDFDHYTPEQRLYVKGLVKETIEYLKSNNSKITYGIEEYLQQPSS